MPCIRIHDLPRFRRRGFMLDVSRHFRDKAFVERMIDTLAAHKMNVFHWHLTDDQGWRIQIDRYPKLTDVAAWRTEAGKPYGGFYTKADIREVVAYAADRYVEVVPEIEMPGHSSAALVAYPEMGCKPLYSSVPTDWGVFWGVYCPGQERTFKYLEDILDEVTELFPSPYLHIGGDEVPKGNWHTCPNCQVRMKAEGLKSEEELQSYFVRRIGDYLATKGKKLIGWDEILEGGVAPGATVQSWRGFDGAVAAAKAGHDVVVSPGDFTYLSRPNDDLTIDRCYAFEPVPQTLSPVEAAHVIGAECCMWAEATVVPRDTELRAFPRLCALAEVFWSPKKGRSWPEFRSRLTDSLEHLKSLGVAVYIDPPTVAGDEFAFVDSTLLKLQPGALGGTIRYTLDGSTPTASSSAFRKPIRIDKTTVVTIATELHGSIGAPRTVKLTRLELLPAVHADSTSPGLSASYYEGVWTALPNFTRLSPVATGEAQAFDLKLARRDTDYGLVFTGYLDVPADGRYDFTLTSDDGSRLTLDGRVVIDHDGVHAMVPAKGSVALAKGLHSCKLEFFQHREAAGLRLELSGPGFARRVVDATMLRH